MVGVQNLTISDDYIQNIVEIMGYACSAASTRRNPQQRLLIFTEFKDTLAYLVKKLKEWNFTVGTIRRWNARVMRLRHGSTPNSSSERERLRYLSQPKLLPIASSEWG